MIENAVKIEGAMDVPELEWLAEQAKKHTIIAEVGCWKGRSTTVLADNTGGVVFAVDTWFGSEEHQELLKNSIGDDVYVEFFENMKSYIDRGKVRVIRLPSVTAARRLYGYPFDMVFVDASHDYESVKADITIWKSVLRFGGLLCGHDIGYPPVNQAVSELIKDFKTSGVIWYTQIAGGA